MLTSVILVLQETIEASLIISVLMAYSLHAGLSRKWVLAALAGGVGFAFVYADQVAVVSEWFDYVGLEVVNATMQLLILVSLLGFAILGEVKRSSGLFVPGVYAAMVIIVILAIAREGFEILLYVSGFVGDGFRFSPEILGSTLGGGIGISVGALLYYFLVGIDGSIGRRVVMTLLALFAGNMAAQGTLLLIQAGWLPSREAIWDSSSFIPENTLVGQLLYALVGYEATPTAIQAGAYFAGTALMLAVFAIGFYRGKVAGGSIANT